MLDLDVKAVISSSGVVQLQVKPLDIGKRLLGKRKSWSAFGKGYNALMDRAHVDFAITESQEKSWVSVEITELFSSLSDFTSGTTVTLYIETLNSIYDISPAVIFHSSDDPHDRPKLKICSSLDKNDGCS
mmetsp:Transcript_2316/g.3490  ORF Transcript_2316/g.3490 Transcript_2316/m.3490 type:complete len:130 (+) Transcript_2316:458-847(+)